MASPIYAGSLLGAGQVRPTRSVLAHLFEKSFTRPLCGSFTSGRIYFVDDDHRVCKLCVGPARKNFPQVLI